MKRHKAKDLELLVCHREMGHTWKELTRIHTAPVGVLIIIDHIANGVAKQILCYSFRALRQRPARGRSGCTGPVVEKNSFVGCVGKQEGINRDVQRSGTGRQR